MHTELFTEFPRVHTAIAEWIACLIYIIPRTKRFRGWKLFGVCASFFAVLLLTNVPSEHEDGFVWVMLMIGCMVEMFLMIFSAAKPVFGRRYIIGLTLSLRRNLRHRWNGS